MDVMRPVVIIFLTLTFKGLFLGATVAAAIQPYQLDVDTSHRDCDTVTASGALAPITPDALPRIACYIGNFVRPILGGFAFIINGAIFIIALAGMAGIDGAPWWIGTTLTAIFAFCFVWALIALLRGTKS